MTPEKFDQILESRIAIMRKTLASKAKEYAAGKDRLYNFKRAAEIDRTTPAKALQGMKVKHDVSLLDLIEGRIPLTRELVTEKIKDSINYLVLLEAIFTEELETEDWTMDGEV